MFSKGLFQWLENRRSGPHARVQVGALTRLREAGVQIGEQRILSEQVYLKRNRYARRPTLSWHGKL
jgi:hypothetical protein